MSDPMSGTWLAFDTFEDGLCQPINRSRRRWRLPINGASQYYTPAATSTAVGGQINVDNRYQNIDVTVTSGTIAVGDSLYNCWRQLGSPHHQRVTRGRRKHSALRRLVPGAGGTGTIQISPAIISAEGATDAEIQYQNVSATPANGAAVTFLNVAAADINPFWHYDSMELLPARYVMPSNSGLAVMSATTDQGIPVLFTRQGDINTLGVKYRLDVFFGTVMTNPEMAGILLFNQT